MENWKMVDFKVISDKRGDMIPLEYPLQLPFDLKRVYYIYNVGKEERRGYHSHYDLEQILIAVHGSVTIMVKTLDKQEDIVLNNPSKGLYIGPMVWREMYDFSDDAVLLVLASHKYDEEDYIRDYETYMVKAKDYFGKKDN